MAKYGFCENCGCTLEAVGCPNCDELEVIQYLNSLDEQEDEE